MRRLLIFLKRFYFIIIFIAYEAIAVTFLIQNNRFHHAKFYNAFDEVSGSIYKRYSNILIYFTLKKENDLLLANIKDGETAFRWDEGGGPLGLIIGDISADKLQTAARILLRYTRCQKNDTARLIIVSDADEPSFSCSNDFSAEDVEGFRI